jgi:hypothetical protein
MARMRSGRSVMGWLGQSLEMENLAGKGAGRQEITTSGRTVCLRF